MLWFVGMGGGREGGRGGIRSATNITRQELNTSLGRGGGGNRGEGIRVVNHLVIKRIGNYI